MLRTQQPRRCIAVLAVAAICSPFSSAFVCPLPAPSELGLVPFGPGCWSLRVWLPHASPATGANLSLTATWRGFQPQAMQWEPVSETWSAVVQGASIGDAFRYRIDWTSGPDAGASLHVIDPRCRIVQSELGAAYNASAYPGTPPDVASLYWCVLHDASAVWASYAASEAAWAPPLPSEQVQYEFHIASWAALGAGASSTGPAPDRSLSGVLSRLNYLTALGVNVIQIMPVHESLKQCNSRDANGTCIYTVGWGYDVQHLFAVEACMGHDALGWVPGQAGTGLPGSSGTYVASYYLLQQLVAEAHRRGIAVLIDVCFNQVYRPINMLASIDGWRAAAAAAAAAAKRALAGADGSRRASGTVVEQSNTATADSGSQSSQPASWDFAGIYFFDQQPQASSPWGPRTAHGAVPAGLPADAHAGGPSRW